MLDVSEQSKEKRLIITFELPKGEGYEEIIRKIGLERQYTNSYGKSEDSPHQIARRIFIEMLNQKIKDESITRSQEASIPL